MAGGTRYAAQPQAHKQAPQGQLDHQESRVMDEPRQWAVDAARAVTAAEAEVNAVADVSDPFVAPSSQTLAFSDVIA